MLLALQEQCDLAPLERPVSVAKGAGAVLLAFCRTHALGIALAVGLLHFEPYLLLGGVAQPAAAVLEMLDQRMNVDAVRL